MTYRPRLFAGIELDARVRKGCAAVAERLRTNGVDGRFEDAAKLHITLAFLGFVDPEFVEEAGSVLRAIAQSVPPFTLTLDRIGAFPSERKPKVVFVGARDQGAAFRRLAYTARAAYEQVGFAFEKDAVAHVTIARVKGGHAHLPLLDVPAMHLHVTQIALFESLPDERTTRYEVRSRAALNPGA